MFDHHRTCSCTDRRCPMCGQRINPANNPANFVCARAVTTEDLRLRQRQLEMLEAAQRRSMLKT